MSRLGDLLELLHGARAFSSTVQATVVTWQHTERALTAFRAGVQEDSSVEYAYGPTDLGASPAETTVTTRLWLAGSELAREETDGRFAVRRGRRWWSYDEVTGAVSNEGEMDVSASVGDDVLYLFEPGWVLGVMSLVPAGRGEVNGREAVLAQARPRPARTPEADWTLHQLGYGADEWLLAVDAEHGVLLRVTACRDEQDFQRVDVTELTIGAPIDGQRFVFTPPAGEQIAQLARQAAPRPGRVSDVAQRAPFGVFVPDELASAWDLEISLVARDPAVPVGVWVGMLLASRDGYFNITIRQTGVGDPVRDQIFTTDAGSESWEDRDDLSRPLRVRRPASAWAPAVVRLTIDETELELTSDSVGAAELVDLALRLAPAPTAPPSFEE